MEGQKRPKNASVKKHTHRSPDVSKSDHKGISKKSKHKSKKHRHRSPSSDSSSSLSDLDTHHRHKRGHKRKKKHHSRSRSREKRDRRHRISRSRSRERERHGRHHRRKRRSPSSRSSSSSCSSCTRETRRHTGIDLNSPNVKFTGSSAPPLQSRSKNPRSRKSILSGKYANMSQLVRHEETWPHACLDRQLSGQPPDYDDMSYCQFFAGMVGKVLREIHPDAVGTHSENQLRHLFRLATYGTNTTRESMLKMNENLFLAIEAGQLGWNSWRDIQGHHERYLDSIRLQSGTADNSKVKLDIPKKDKATYVSTEYMRANSICFKFQNYICEHPESHLLDGTNNKVLHICGLCHMSKKENVPTHGYKQCPLKKKKNDREN